MLLKTIEGELDEHGFAIIPNGHIYYEDVMMPIKMLIDTGGGSSVISNSVLSKLGAPSVGFANLVNPGFGITESSLHNVGVRIHDVDFGSLYFRSYPGERIIYPVILGVDFIKMCTFKYFGIERKYELVVWGS